MVDGTSAKSEEILTVLQDLHSAAVPVLVMTDYQTRSGLGGLWGRSVARVRAVYGCCWGGVCGLGVWEA